MVSEVNLTVKQHPFWKTASYLIWISRYFCRYFEGATVEDLPDYKWMYYFNPSSSKNEDIVFRGLSDMECFAAVAINRCIEQSTKDQETVLDLLHFNRELLNRVSENMPTCMTKE